MNMSAEFRRYFAFCCLLLSLGACTARDEAATDEAAIRKMLSAQVAQWNRGDIAGYMHGYWESDSLVFIGKNGPTNGFDSTLARYRRSYPDAATMGKLTSTILRIRHLSPDYAYVTGKWHLARAAGDLQGHYTLLLRKIGNEWVIIEDHSS
jgi:ketosteroid isomerase-like protein